MVKILLQKTMTVGENKRNREKSDYNYSGQSAPDKLALKPFRVKIAMTIW